MSAVILGKTSGLLLGTTLANKVTITGIGVGTSNITAGHAQDSRPAPGGRGVLAAQLGNFTTNDFAIATDSNSVHDPIFRRVNGQRLYGTWRPEGEGSGLPEYTFEAVATVSLTLDMGSDAATWAITLAVDGEPAETTQA